MINLVQKQKTQKKLQENKLHKEVVKWTSSNIDDSLSPNSRSKYFNI